MKRYLLILVASIIVISCGDEQQFFTKIGKSEAEQVRVRFIHAAYDTVGANLFIEDQKISSGGFSVVAATGAVNIGRVGFGSDFPVTGYVAAGDVSGAVEIIVPQVYTAADTFPTKTLATTNAALAASKWYTVALVGISPSYESIVYEDNLTATPLDNKAYIRLVNFIPNMGTDELTLRGTPPPTTADPAPTPVNLITDISYKEMSGFIALPRTGQYSNVQIVNETSGTVLYTVLTTSANRTFVNNKVYTVFAQGIIGGVPGANNAPGTAPFIGRMTNR